ncbi:MAG: type IV pilin protein [Terriglobales bacterium]
MRALRPNSSTRFCFTWRTRERPERPRAPSVPVSVSITPSLPGTVPARKHGAAAGVTLIELLIAVVIVGILATIAYPSYQEHLRKNRRAVAQSFMVDVAARQQQYLIDARSYAGGAGALGALNLAMPGDVSRFYTVTIDPAAPAVPPSYTITSTPNAGSPQVPDGVLTLDHQGAKTRNGQSGW